MMSKHSLFPRAVWGILLTGVMARLLFFPRVGFEQDFLFIISWSEYLAQYSPVTIYDHPEQLSVKFINYPPLYLYFLTGAARLFRGFTERPFYSLGFLALIKSLTLGFEIWTGLVLWGWTKRHHGPRAGAWALGLYFLNPAIVYLSAYYGQVDAIFAAFLLWAMVSWAEDRPGLCGAALAFALAMKLQSVAFLPFFFLLPLIRNDKQAFIFLMMGFAGMGVLLLSPYLVHGRMHALINECVIRSIEWGKFVSVGAFNLWYLHADPVTHDYRIWGWLYGLDGMVSAHPLIRLFTYKNLGTALFGLAFLAALYGVWKHEKTAGPWIAAMHIGLAFYLLPTKVHERYLFPYFVFAAPWAVEGARRIFFLGFSLTYLVNLMVVCPLFGEVKNVTDIDTPLGTAAAALNLVLYILFIAYEYIAPAFPARRRVILAKAGTAALAGVGIILFLRHEARIPDPSILYLSQLTPRVAEQDWPVEPKANTRKGYEKVNADLSVEENELQIGRTLYRYGLGTHANSRIEYDIPGEYQWFECHVGLDAEVRPNYEARPDRASVIFTVWINGQKQYESPLMFPPMAPQRVLLPLPETKGFNRLRLEVSDGGDGNNSDHADWALARVKRPPPAE
ncbi:MAG TPA: NPCBM/NEW2 domain-containing protein [bacterium]|nr:NPCBM/NEW2 domain-containing protein [bacterium]